MKTTRQKRPDRVIKEKIYLEFSYIPMIYSLYRTEQAEMIGWCKSRGMNWSESVATDGVIIEFSRDKNTLDFIKTFLEPKVNHALPFSSLQSIDGVRIVNLES